MLVTIDANAKINLTLDILGKRTDGYHEVAMVMQEISLADTLRLERAQAGIHLRLDVPGLPADHRNLAWRAARLIMETYSLNDGVRIELQKRIPIAAGLAGGSADAAGVLRGMNELFGLGLSVEELCALGAQLGSDIPFCIMGGTMRATGRGEVLRRLPPLPECFVVLAKPPISVSTAWAYQNYDLLGAEKHPDNEAIQKQIAAKDIKAVSRLLCNVLESVTIKKHKEIDGYKKLMDDNGAMASMMSGSGPTVFALADTEQTAAAIADAVKRATEAAVFVVKTVIRS